MAAKKRSTKPTPPDGLEATMLEMVNDGMLRVRRSDDGTLLFSLTEKGTRAAQALIERAKATKH